MIKQPWEIAVMRQSGKKLAEVVEVLREHIKPGISTAELDCIAEEEIRKRQGQPSFKGYRGFPATICSSLNDGVVHGIPNKKPLKEGDLVSIDLGLCYGGYHADMAFSLYLGRPPDDVAVLLAGTQAALTVGIELCKPGHTIGTVGAGIQKLLGIYDLGIVEGYCGHGIGRKVHEEPSIPNFGVQGQGLPFRPGMMICLEPMATLGKPGTKTKRDGWTVVTKDGSLSAHFEHTVLITNQGPEVLTSL